MEDNEAAKKKLQREVEALLQREEDLVAENSRLEKSRKKMQEEVGFIFSFMCLLFLFVCVSCLIFSLANIFLVYWNTECHSQLERALL